MLALNRKYEKASWPASYGLWREIVRGIVRTICIVTRSPLVRVPYGGEKMTIVINAFREKASAVSMPTTVRAADTLFWLAKSSRRQPAYQWRAAKQALSC